MVLGRKQEQAMQKAAREKEISKVKVQQEDVDLIVSYHLIALVNYSKNYE